ncbi:Hypothetical predicted protein [Cloeon dipterum]|uniref:F-box domain-containing protein n=1 Tax=Cloeon dipterum TaxID=197152 RepID=A0A8S1DM15_9INSE|nr:Hypothetical predicted protein [Cloeon dipterum]
MNYDQLFLLAVERTWRLENERGWMELVDQDIVENIADENQQQRLLTLPDNRRRNVLSKFMKERCTKGNGNMEEFENRLKALKLLLTPQTVEIKIDGLMTFSPQDAKEIHFLKVLRLISKDAPNLQTFSVFLEIRADREILDKIISFKSLHNLDFSKTTVTYSELSQICRELENLQHVNIQIWSEGELHLDVEDFKNSFRRLKTFLFTIQNDVHRQSSKKAEKEFWRLCVRELPHLEIVGRVADDPVVTHGQLRVIELPASTSNLRHLVTRPNNLGMHLAFPNVTHLNIDFWDLADQSAINAMLQFSSRIESLILVTPPIEVVVSSFLSKYGCTLKNLVINNSWMALRYLFEPIIRLCPHLKKLTLLNVEMVDDLMRPAGTLQELTHFEWYPPKRHYSGRCATLSSFLKIAPNLQSLRLRNEWFWPEDLKIISNLIAEQKILQKLEQLHFDHLSDLEIPSDYKTNPEFQQFAAFFPVLSGFIKYAIALCPVLKDVYIFVQSHEDDLETFIEEKYGENASSLTDETLNEEALFMLGEENLVQFIRVFNPHLA